MTSLKTLDISWTEVSDLEPLGNLANLHTINVIYSYVNNYSQLEPLLRLEERFKRLKLVYFTTALPYEEDDYEEDDSKEDDSEDRSEIVVPEMFERKVCGFEIRSFCEENDDQHIWE
eukprot:Awhi_evm1s11016